MSQIAYRNLSDDDIEAVIAFLRSQQPVATTHADGDRINLPGAIMFSGAGMLPLPAPIAGAVAAPPAGATPQYGRYVAILGNCLGCHGP